MMKKNNNLLFCSVKYKVLVKFISFLGKSIDSPPDTAPINSYFAVGTLLPWQLLVSIMVKERRPFKIIFNTNDNFFHINRNKFTVAQYFKK